MRVKTGTTRRAKHKKVLKAAKGYIGRRNSVYKLAKQATVKAGQYAYRDRRVKKRTFRALWILRLNAALRAEGVKYSDFIHGLTLKKIDINRKLLADLAVKEPAAFSAIVAKVK